jgi:polyferredoxin
LETIIEAIQAIQAILAPAVMITGVALLLLTFNARHSSLVNRIRLLDDEERKLLRRRPKLDKIETLRLKSIKTQLDLLLSRLLYVRNGMICLLLAATFFVLTSFSIGLAYFSASTGLTQTMINFTFIPGMLLVLIGVLFLAIEVYISYRVIEIEVMENKQRG